MSARQSSLRRMACAMIRHAARVLPPARLPWAAAMQHELDHIDSDLEALTWAAGCVLAGYVERSRVMHAVDTWYVRIFLALLIGLEALNMLFATALTAAYKLQYLGAAAFLGGFTPGDDYRRFIPLMEATRWWTHALYVAAAVLFAASAWELLRKRRSAFPLFAVAWILGTIGNLISQSMPAYRQALSFPEPLLMRDYVIPAATALLPLFIAGVIWAHQRCAAAREA